MVKGRVSQRECQQEENVGFKEVEEFKENVSGRMTVRVKRECQWKSF